MCATTRSEPALGISIFTRRQRQCRREATVLTMAAEWAGEDEVLFAASFSNSGNSSNIATSSERLAPCPTMPALPFTQGPL